MRPSISMTTQRLKTVGLKTALYSLIISSLLFVSYYLTNYDKLIYLEYIFIFVSTTFCLIILLRILNQAFKHKRHKTSLLIISAFVLVSVLVSFVFFKYMTSLLDTLRINLVNATQSEITDIKLTGCKKIRLARLNAGEDQTVSLKVERDCAIEISYSLNGASKKEMVANFVTTSMGKKITYVLGAN